jgi:hypothetical protein
MFSGHSWASYCVRIIMKAFRLMASHSTPQHDTHTLFMSDEEDEHLNLRNYQHSKCTLSRASSPWVAGPRLRSS